MELIDQKTKKIMEECKIRARDHGLRFDNETLEYIVTNRDLIYLSPKVMIPTLYDYWVNDVEVLKEEGRYKLYPNNPYETVINSRPAISFYNDNNPDWLNIMIFYHVLAHIDFFQNNIFFQHTANDDFVGQALADKRLIDNLRSEYGRWTDYVIEFSRSIDNIVGFYKVLPKPLFNDEIEKYPEINFYFNVFLQDIIDVPPHQIFKEIERYNSLLKENHEMAELLFLNDIKTRYPEFESIYEKNIDFKRREYADIMQYIIDNSPVLNNKNNLWMKSVVTIIRNTALYFAPQIRTKIINEGWASYWHDYLFRLDDRIAGHEIAYAKINAGVTSISRVGLNPYAIGLRLLQYVEQLADDGKLDYNFQKITDFEQRQNYKKSTGKGKETLFEIRKNFSDFMLINTYVDQEFVDMHNLFVVGTRYNQQRNTIQYYIASRKANDYKQMLLDSLYHPPLIVVDETKSNENNLYLTHIFEGKQLYKPYIPDTMIGLEFLWGSQVQLETTELVAERDTNGEIKNIKKTKVLYTVKDRKLTKSNL